MAKIQTLKERDTDVTLYPETTSEAVYFRDGKDAEQKVKELDLGKVDKIEGRGLSTNDYTDEDKETLAALATELPDKEDSFTLSDDLQMSATRELSVTEKAKRALFIEMWTLEFDCQYNATKAKPFRCNGLDLSYEEAKRVYLAPRLTYHEIPGLTESTLSPKTIILGSKNTNGARPSISNTFRSTSFVCLRISNSPRVAYFSDTSYAFYNCVELNRILGIFNLSNVVNVNHMFTLCYKLEDVNISELKLSLSFEYSSKLSYNTLSYLVTNAANSSAITVTVHPDVYAKITGDTDNNAYSSLTDAEKAQWATLLPLAVSKNISFATV